MPALGAKYELGERIGGGGMADVFRAVVRGAEGFSRPVAIKYIKASISADKNFGQMFTAEARLAARLTHPNIVQTVDFDRDETGRYYIVMELIEGVDLRQLTKTGALPVSAIAHIIAEVLRALDYAHELVADGTPITVVHRDISPHNVMMDWQGGVKIVDFGVAKAIEGSMASLSGSLKGKVSYMSPEQVHGQALDGRSDLFAVGVMMHELLTHKRLFVAPTEAATLSQLLTQPIPLPTALNEHVPADLEAVTMKLLERDRDCRYSRARDALEAVLECESAHTRGRFDLEAVLAERFPSRAPQRVARLSSAPSRVADSSGAATLGLASAPSASVGKITATAGPSLEGAQTPRRLQISLLIFVALALFGAIAFLILRDDKTTTQQGIEVVVQPDASSTTRALLTPGQAMRLDAALDLGAVVDAGSEVMSPYDAARPDAKPIDRKIKRASLRIQVKPWASIEIDGRAFGQTPQTISLKRGRHRLILRNPGLEKRESLSLNLKPGETRVIQRDWL